METTGTLIEGLTKLNHIPVNSIPVRGYITDEDDERFWLRDHEGTWIVRKADVVATGEYQGVSDPRITGKPVLLFIREGADIYELRSFTVRMSTPPITLQPLARGVQLRVKGSEVTPVGTEEASRQIGFRPSTRVLASSDVLRVTVCCYDDADGTTCAGDDSGNDVCEP